MGFLNDFVGFDFWVFGINNIFLLLFIMVRILFNRGFLFLCFFLGDLFLRIVEDVKILDLYKYERFRVNFSFFLDFRCNII